jgi:hypothetical protein
MGNAMRKKQKYRGQKALLVGRLVITPVTVAILALVFASPAGATFTRYFRASSVTGGPGAYKTADNPSGTTEEQLMTLVMGDAISSSSHTEIGNATYVKGVIFVSDALAAESIDVGTWTVHSHAKESNAGLNAYLKWYVYKWDGSTATTIAGPSEHGDELSNADKAYSLDMSGSAVSFAAGDRLVVEVYFHIYATSASRTATLYWGMTTPASPSNTDDDGWITGPGSNVPTLGWPLLLAAVSFFTFFMIKKGKLSPRMGLATLFLLLVLVFGSRLTPQRNPILASSWQDMQATSVIGPKGKGYALRPVSLNSSNSSPHASEPGGARR